MPERFEQWSQPWIIEDDKKAVLDVLDQADLMSGRKVREFEERLADYLGIRYVVCVNSGTAALECAFVATGEGKLIHPHGFIAILSAAHAAHGQVKLDEDGIRTSVLGLVEGAKDYSHRVYDACQAFGTGGLPGDVHCYSFNQNKPIGCVGGCLVTDDENVAQIARLYRNHGRNGDQSHGAGRNLRMGEINAALGLSQLNRIDDILGRRKQVADWYDEITAQDLAGTRDSWFLYPVATHRDHPFRTMADFRLLDTASDLDRCTALLPIHPEMTRIDVQSVVKRLEVVCS